MSEPLRGRTAAVTGASRGIGFAIARTFAADGARVALLARSSDALAAAAESIGSGAIPIVCDVRDAGSVARATGELTDRLGGVPDVVVCAAGVFPLGPLAGISPDEFADALLVNVLGAFLTVRGMMPGMLARGSGHLVLIGSLADRTILPENGAYAASKFGARALWEVLRAELRGTGVRCTIVSPGPTDTGIWDPHAPDDRPGFVGRHAMLDPDAVADAVRYVVTRPAGVAIDELRLSPA